MPAAAPSYALISGIEEFERLCARLLADGRPFGFDIETSYEGEEREAAQLHPEENFVAGLSLTNSAAWGRYASLNHDDGDNLDNGRAAQALWPLLQTGLGVAHGAKFELRCLSRWFLQNLPDHPQYGSAVRDSRGYFPVRSCTMLESYAEAANRGHGLKDITLANFGHKMTEIMELFPGALTRKQQKSIRFSSLDQHDPKVIAYACEDALWCLAHHYRRYPQLRDSFIYQVEMNLLPVVCSMEDTGVLCDWLFFQEAAARARVFLEKLQAEIGNDLTAMLREKDPAASPVRINLGSPAQIATVLYGQLGMSTRRRSRNSGKMSTDKIALKSLAAQYPVVQKILSWKSLRKLLGTYLEVYEQRYSYASDGHTHPNHLQHGVPAGRFAVADWPYQQSPKKYHYVLSGGTEFRFNFRDGVTAPAGCYLLGFDYSQIELRVLAGEAGETALIEAFARGEDVHRKTAALMLGKLLEDITSEDRAIGKTMNFALGYQMGVDGLADRLGLTKDEAQRLFDQYFGVYTKIKAYMERTIARARATGYVVTRFGRKVRIWEFDSTERYIYAQGERLAGNAPIQGGAADYMKITMIRVARAIAQSRYRGKIRLVMNIHDALEFYVDDDVPVDAAIRLLQPAVVWPVQGWPPMVAEWHAGRRWGSVRELELTADGSVRLAGAEAEEKPSLDEDEDTGTEADREVAAAMKAALGHQPAPALPEPEPPGPEPEPVPAVAAVPAGTGDSRTVLIHLQQLPAREEFSQLREMVNASPGSNLTLLALPDGARFPLGRTAIDPSWQATIAVIFGGVMVCYDLDSIDCSALAAGLEL